MIVSLALILLAQLLGEVVAHASGAPVPGPAIGAALVSGFLPLRDRHRRAAAALPPPPPAAGGWEEIGG